MPPFAIRSPWRLFLIVFMVLSLALVGCKGDKEKAAKAKERTEGGKESQTPPAKKKDRKTTSTATIEKLPANVGEFLQLRTTKAKTPEGAISMYIMAMLVASQDNAAGTEMARQILHPKTLIGGNLGASLKDKFQRLKSPSYEKIAHCYVAGTTPPHYKLPAMPYTINLNNESATSGKGITEYFLECTGSDTWRPIKVAKSEDLWYVRDGQSLMSQVRGVSDIQ